MVYWLFIKFNLFFGGNRLKGNLLCGVCKWFCFFVEKVGIIKVEFNIIN